MAATTCLANLTKLLKYRNIIELAPETFYWIQLFHQKYLMQYKDELTSTRPQTCAFHNDYNAINLDYDNSNAIHFAWKPGNTLSCPCGKKKVDKIHKYTFIQYNTGWEIFLFEREPGRQSMIYLNTAHVYRDVHIIRAEN